MNQATNKGFVEGPRPSGALRWFLRAPIHLYKAKLGWMLGGRFMLIEHIGRKSKAPRFTVVETVSHDRESDTYYACSGWGERSDWFQNLMHDPHATITIGTRKFSTLAVRVDPDAATPVLADYQARHPAAFKELFKRMMGRPYTGQDAIRDLAQVVPMVAFKA